MRIGLTGATGFIGQRLLPLLGKHDLRLTVLTGEHIPESSNLKPETLFPVNLATDAPPEAFYRDLDVLVHMVGSFSQDFATLMTLNLGTLMNVLEPLEHLKKKPRVVFTSSCAVYGETPAGAASKESDPLRPSTPYGFAKQWSEEYLAWHADRHGYETTLLRFPNIYGPGSQAVMAKFLERIEAGKSVYLDGDGQQVRDFLYVADAAAGLARAIEANQDGIFNISTGNEMTLTELLDAIGSATGTTPKIEPRPNNPFTQQRTVLDPTRAKQQLGWQPTTAFEEGLKATIDATP